MKTILMTALLAMTLSNSAFGKDDPKTINKLAGWVNSHLAYPTPALETKQEGTVYVAFSIVNGEMTEAEVVGSVSKELDAAALEAVKNIPATTLYEVEDIQKVYILPIKFEIK